MSQNQLFKEEQTLHIYIEQVCNGSLNYACATKAHFLTCLYILHHASLSLSSHLIFGFQVLVLTNKSSNVEKVFVWVEETSLIAGFGSRQKDSINIPTNLAELQ